MTLKLPLACVCRRRFGTETALAMHQKATMCGRVGGRQARAAARAGWLCHWCGTPMARDRRSPRAATIEHVIPRADGGGDGDANTVAACALCNNLRGRMEATAFARLMRGDSLARWELWPRLFRRDERLPIETLGDKA